MPFLKADMGSFVLLSYVCDWGERCACSCASGRRGDLYKSRRGCGGGRSAFKRAPNRGSRHWQSGRRRNSWCHSCWWLEWRSSRHHASKKVLRRNFYIEMLSSSPYRESIFKWNWPIGNLLGSRVWNLNGALQLRTVRNPIGPNGSVAGNLVQNPGQKRELSKCIKGTIKSTSRTL